MDAEWLDRLRDFKPLLFKYFSRVAKTPADMEDLISDVWADVCKTGLPPTMEELHAILMHYAARAARIYSRRTRHEIRANTDRGFEQEDGVDELKLEARRQWVEAALATLSARQREVAMLCIMNEMTRATAAQRIGIDEDTVRVHLHRALKALTKLAERTPPRKVMLSNRRDTLGLTLRGNTRAS